MVERPVVPIVETPVANQHLFLANTANGELVMGRKLTPNLRYTSTIGSYTSTIGDWVIYLSIILLSFGGALTVSSWIQAAMPFLFMVGVATSLIAIGRYRFTQFQKVPGQIVEGEVTYAERQRTIKQRDVREVFLVDYRFIAPDQMIKHASAVVPCYESNAFLAPMPGTPVKVWYREDGQFYLL